MNQELERYFLVNQAETLDELADIILKLSDQDGMLNARHRQLNGVKMAAYCRNFKNMPFNVLTRNYGIRQQAMYICLSEITTSINFLTLNK